MFKINKWIMKYEELNEEAKKAAVINYCHITEIDLNQNREWVINWFLTRKVDTLDIDGKFIHSKNNIA